MPKPIAAAVPFALLLAACAPPPANVIPPRLAAYLTPAERADINEETAGLRESLRAECSGAELDVVSTYLPYAAVNLAAGQDAELRDRLKGDAALTEDALAAREARLAVSEQCDTALRSASWGIL